MKEPETVSASAKAGGETKPPGFAPRWIALALAITTLAAFWPVVHCQFVNYDDTDFVTANPQVQAGLSMAGFKWVWRSEVARNWHPITMLTHMLDCQLFGLQPWWPHLVNLLLHTANAVLLFYLLRSMTGATGRSAFVAGLFALHPLHVESVAWVAERKDVLSTLFWFLTIWAYVRYARAADNARFRFSDFASFYVLALVLDALGLMSKPMLVTLPFTLLLLDFWPLGRFGFGRRIFEAPASRPAKTAAGGKSTSSASLKPTRQGATPASWGRLILEKAPFLLLSAAVCVVTFRIQQHGSAVRSVDNFPLSQRTANAVVSYANYIGKMLWPVDLAGLYLKLGQWAAWQVALAALWLAGTSAVVAAQWRRRPFLFTGWCWYLGTLVPVIGLVQVGMQSMADRYTYVPLIGIFIIVAWQGWEWAAAWRATRFVPAAALVILGMCALLTRHQAAFWKDSETLFKRMIDVVPGNYMARYNMGNLYSKENRIDDAVSNYLAALQAEPNYPDAHNNLAGVYLGQKRYDEAIDHYRTALRLDTQFLRCFNLANALADSASARHDAAQFNEAVQTYHQALQLKPDSAEAHYNLALTWQAQGRDDEAAPEFAEAFRIDPGNADRWRDYGLDCARRRDMARAAAAFEQLVRLRPNDASAAGWLANALAEQNKLAEAIPYYLTALRLDPNDFQTEFNLGLTFARQGKNAEAAEHYRQALRLNPNYSEAQRALEDLQKSPAPAR